MSKFCKKISAQYSLAFSSSSYYNLLEDFLLVKRYLRRNFGYSVKFFVQTDTIVKKKKITLLRSPFVHKKAQEHFSLTRYTLKIKILFSFVLWNYSEIYWLFFFFKKNFKKLTGSVERLSYKFIF